MEPVVSTPTELDAVRARRAELRGSIDLVEFALARPPQGREVAWGEAVHAALRTLAHDFDAHVAVTEGPDGLHHAILAGDVRLANAVTALTQEHVGIGRQLAQLVDDTEPPVTDADTVRDRATHLLGGLVRHRQRGADLIYEAYATDIGGND